MLANMTHQPLPYSPFPSGKSLRLDTLSFTLDDPREQRMLQAIADATENTRIDLRNDPSWGTPIPIPDRGFVPVARRKRVTTLADLLPWPALLTLKGCADDAACQAECGNRQEILQFAQTICPYEHLVTLVNFIANDLGIANAAKVLSPLIRGLKAKEARIKKGASEGGRKSALTRQRSSSTADAEKLLQDRQRLLDAGRDTKEIAGILAARYRVSDTTVRRKLKKAAKANTE